MRSVSEVIAYSSGLSLPVAARIYATAGIPVFPCVPGEKRPLTKRGFHDATTSLPEVSTWWSRWPEANIAIPTGPASGIGVVDVDINERTSGYAAFERARGQGLAEGWVVLVRTPSGGLHAYYPADTSRGQGSWQAAAAHVDFRGTGGYIIAPPSQIAIDADRVGSYALIASTTSTPLPVDAGRLREFLDHRIEPVMRPGPVRGIDTENLARWVAERGEGERNRGLFWAACRMAENGTPPVDTHAALAPAAKHAGLTSREVSATIRSAYRTTHPKPCAATDGHQDSPRRPPRRTVGQVLS